MQLLRKISQSGLLLLALMLIITILVDVTTAAASPAKANTFPAVREVSATRSSNSNIDLLHGVIRSGRLAPTVHVLSSLPPTTIIQFPLLPSGIKKAFPQATGLVTIVRGDRNNAFSDTVTVDVQNMPPNITFTILYIQFASKPFGNVEYVADLTTRGDGSGETVFQNIAFVAFALDDRHPVTSQDGQEGTN